VKPCEIRSATGEDVAAIAEIYAHYVRTSTVTFEFDPPDAAETARRMDAVRELGFPFLVAELDGRVVGYASAKQFRPRPAYRFTAENSIYVAPAHLGRGIGRQLLTALIDGCRNAGAKQMIALMVGDNPASVAFHAAHGFEPAGVLRSVGFKFDQWLDLTLMQRAL
jgi:L-amino acid N-acyltransferase YncA